MTPTATVTDLTIAASADPLLKGVDLELEPGEVTGLVGASGAGKTTLALALIGHLPPGLQLQSGRVRVAGHDPFTKRDRIAIRGRATAYLPQDPASALDPARTVSAQLHSACRIAHPSARMAERAAIVRDAARDASLEPKLLRRRPLELSGGQAQRALLAWTFATQPQLLILDEPTSSLDSDTALLVSRSFTQLPWRPAVLFVSHDRELIARVADRALELDGGRLRRFDATSPEAAAPVHLTTRMTSRRPRLAAAGVTVRRGGRTIVREVELYLEAGELVAMRGRSGAGKTSLARALAGLAPPTAGTLRIDEHPVHWEAGARARANDPYVAYVGQDARAALHPAETVHQTLQRAITTARERRAALFQDAGELLELVGLSQDLLARTPGRLSGGERHRLVLARAIAASPSALICDETTAALDRDTAARILDLIDGIRHDTCLPVLLITHQDMVAARADRVLTLKEGSLS